MVIGTGAWSSAFADILVTAGMHGVPPDSRHPTSLLPKLLTVQEYVELFPANKSAVPPICQEANTVCAINNLGGSLSGFMLEASHLNKKNAKLVIWGACESACTLLAGRLPGDNVCMGPYATLGLHGAMTTDWPNEFRAKDGKWYANQYANIKDTEKWAQNLPVLQKKKMLRTIPKTPPGGKITEQEWNDFFEMKSVKNSPFRKYYKPCPTTAAYSAARPEKNPLPEKKSTDSPKYSGPTTTSIPSYRALPANFDTGVDWSIGSQGTR